MGIFLILITCYASLGLINLLVLFPRQMGIKSVAPGSAVILDVLAVSFLIYLVWKHTKKQSVQHHSPMFLFGTAVVSLCLIPGLVILVLRFF